MPGIVSDPIPFRKSGLLPAAHRRDRAQLPGRPPPGYQGPTNEGGEREQEYAAGLVDLLARIRPEEGPSGTPVTRVRPTAARTLRMASGSLLDLHADPAGTDGDLNSLRCGNQLDRDPILILHHSRAGASGRRQSSTDGREVAIEVV